MRKEKTSNKERTFGLYNLAVERIEKCEKVRKGIIPFPIIFESLCRSFSITKKEAWEIVKLLKDRSMVDAIGGSIVKGTIMFGPPGCGKTYLAKAMATECGMPMISAVGSEFVAMFMGQGAARMKALFKQARNIAKIEGGCIIFIDEIDLLRLQRGNGNNELLSEFLSAMSGVLSKDSGAQVILLAATNRPEHLDKALRRRGRFGKIIHFELPTLAERKAFFVQKLEPLILDLSKIDIDKLAQETEDKTYEELSTMTNAAFQKTKLRGEPLTQNIWKKASTKKFVISSPAISICRTKNKS